MTSKMNKCRIKGCRRPRELFITLDYHTYGICRKHYNEIIVEVSKLLKSKKSTTLESIIEASPKGRLILNNSS
ncbi:MAG: hypothetical protein DRJ49_00900 [Thermoprotei archaeon]|nr:MAG: hypothetical protein DRJ49_00900 [Thermoprotei archaeon]